MKLAPQRILIYKLFYSAESGLGFSSFFRKLEKKKVILNNPVNPVQKKKLEKNPFLFHENLV